MKTGLPVDGAPMGVPSDLWLDVVSFLEPSDVAALQSICVSLYSLIHQRSVWVSVLRSSCRDQCIFFPSFPVDDMDMDRIQRAALAPEQFTRLIQSKSQLSRDPPSLSSSLGVRLSLPSEAYVNGNTYALVPGGRYLLAGGSQGLRIWDLGPPDYYPLTEPALVASHGPRRHPGVRSSESGRVVLAQDVLNDKTLRIALASESLTVDVYEFTPGRTVSSFQHIGTLLLDSRAYSRELGVCNAMTVSKDIVLMSIAGIDRAVVWNHREGWCACGPGYLNATSSSLKPAKIILGTNIIVEFHKRQVVTWIATEKGLSVFPVVGGQPISMMDLRNSDIDLSTASSTIIPLEVPHPDPSIRYDNLGMDPILVLPYDMGARYQSDAPQKGFQEPIEVQIVASTFTLPSCSEILRCLDFPIPQFLPTSTNASLILFARFQLVNSFASLQACQSPETRLEWDRCIQEGKLIESLKRGFPEERGDDAVLYLEMLQESLRIVT
ncbi:hypothetical protein NMY22_g6459 [Coprinellus aureogranulatus]|nr:hypothetical protein NMY22_g6459 [Coprinellus aureogranulatus]